MENEFIPYEEALALKELGFDGYSLAYYEDYDLKYVDFNIPYGGVAAPLYQQAFRWFQEKYNLETEYSLRAVMEDPDYFLKKLIEIVKENKNEYNIRSKNKR